MGNFAENLNLGKRVLIPPPPPPPPPEIKTNIQNRNRLWNLIALGGLFYFLISDAAEFIHRFEEIIILFMSAFFSYNFNLII